MRETTFWPGVSVWGQVAWGGLGSAWAAEGGRICVSGPEISVEKSPLQLVFSGLDGSLAMWCELLGNTCVWFSLVTMEKIRADGFHGDYLKMKVWTLL